MFLGSRSNVATGQSLVKTKGWRRGRPRTLKSRSSYQCCKTELLVKVPLPPPSMVAQCLEGGSMRALTPGRYGVIHSMEVSDEELSMLAERLGIEKPARLKAGKILIVREVGPEEALPEPPKDGT